MTSNAKKTTAKPGKFDIGSIVRLSKFASPEIIKEVGRDGGWRVLAFDPTKKYEFVLEKINGGNKYFILDVSGTEIEPADFILFGQET